MPSIESVVVIGNKIGLHDIRYELEVRLLVRY